MSRRLRFASLSGISLAVFLTLSHSVNDAFTNVLPVFLPTLQARFSLGEAVLAAMVAVISISSNVLQAFFGAFVDRWGRRKSAALGLGIGSVLMSFIGVAPNVASVFLILMIGGIGSAIFHPAGASMARSTGAPVGLSMSLFASGGSLGVAVMPVVILWVIRNYGIAYVPYLALFGVLMSIGLFVLVPRQEQRPATTRVRIFDPQLIRGPVGLLSAVGIMRSMAFISFTNAMPLFLANNRGFAPDAQVIGLTLSAYSIGSTAGGLLAGVLEPCLGRKRAIIGSMLLALPFMLTTLALEPGSLLYYAAVVLGAASANGSIPLLVITAQDLAPHAVASASGMLMGFTWGTAGVLYIGFGALQELVGLVPAMITGFAFLIPAAFLAHYVLRRHAAAIKTASAR